MPNNEFYVDILKLRDVIESATEIQTIHGARLKMLRISSQAENIALLKRNESLKNVILELSGESIEMPTSEIPNFNIERYLEEFRRRTLVHFNRALLVGHGAK